ncbi:MAG: T9SS type A sorting domain-containing protein [Flavobacteriales bacterium]|nr:T9SS type A sorting domain-containing protein [Flavobacteriales bacterium]
MELDISDPSQPIPVDTLTLGELDGLNAMNVEQVGPLLYVALGGFDDSTQTTGLAIVEVSDPTQPVVLDIWNGGPAYTAGSAIVLIDGGIAYLGGMTDGVIALNVFDPGNIQEIGSFQPDPTWPGIVNYLPNARGMAIDGDVLYLCYDAGALRAIDISTPGSMSQIGQYINPDHPPLFTPNAYNNITLVGTKAYISYDYCGLEVVDISDPTNITQVAWLNPWNCFGLSWLGSDGHTNELVTAMGDSLLFVSGADSELLIYNITDPMLPALAGGHIVPNDTAVAWGVDAHGGLVVSCYLNNSVLLGQPYYSNFGGVVIYAWSPQFATGIEAPVEAMLSVVADPSGHGIVIDRPMSDGQAEVRLLDMNGRCVHRSAINCAHARIDLPGTAPGTYVVTLRGSDGTLAVGKVLLVP